MASGDGITRARGHNGATVMLAAQENDRHTHNPFVRYFKLLGPGLVSGASDDDPGGITTYSVAGASLGYGMLWTAIATFPLMAAVQLICARIGPIRMLFLSAVLNGILAPPLLVLIMLVSNNREIMGRHTNGPWLNLLGWTATVLMAVAAIALLVTAV